ncbi:MAG: cation diffusion facilitator family transporter [Oscillospiraceae bacterium]|nr:cation diffusion facilitator family transporter [Oscillospiraceae bacterium]
MAHNHGGGHGHSHNHEDNIGMAFFLNFSFTIIEVIGGILTNSVAIISDAVHDFGDSLSLALAWYFQRKSKKGGDAKYTYGYRRYSLIGAVITSIVLVIGSVYILSEAAARLFAPQETNAAGMFWLAVLGITANGIGALKTRKASSINERVVSLHLLEDVLGWAAVLIGSALMYFTGLTVIDPILSFGIAFFVLYNVVKNIRQVIPIFLQCAPDGIGKEHILGKLYSIEEVEDVHDLHIWALDEENNILTAHVAVNCAPTPELKEKLRDVLKHEGIQHPTIELEAPGELCAFANCLLERG